MKDMKKKKKNSLRGTQKDREGFDNGPSIHKREYRGNKAKNLKESAGNKPSGTSQEEASSEKKQDPEGRESRAPLGKRGRAFLKSDYQKGKAGRKGEGERGKNRARSLQNAASARSERGGGFHRQDNPP